MRNGDLWKLFYQILHARSSTSFAVSWTKGHALEKPEYLQSHPHLKYQAIHNHKADTLATHAHHTFFNKNLTDLSGLLVQRTMPYTFFASQVHATTFIVYVAAQNLKYSPLFALSHPDLHIPKSVVLQSRPYTSHK
eukprot:4607163-Karenia_brevis.AAC.1